MQHELYFISFQNASRKMLSNLWNWKLKKICKYDPKRARENFILKLFLYTIQMFDLPREI